MRLSNILTLALVWAMLSPACAQTFGTTDVQTVGIDNISVIELVGNDAWVGSSTQGAAFYNNSTLNWVYFNKDTFGLNSNSVRTIFAGAFAGQKNAYLATDSGLVHNIEGVWSTVTPSLGKPIKGIGVRNDSIWVLTNNNILLFDTNPGVNLKQSYSLPVNSPVTVGQKKQAGAPCAGFWAGTADSGAFYTTDGVSFRTLNTTPQAQSLVDNRVNVIAVDNNCGAVLVGTKGGFSRCPAVAPCQNFRVAQGLPQNDIVDIAIDCQGDIWLATRDSGLVVYNNSNFTRVTGLPSNHITTIAFSAAGCRAWVGTQEGDIAVLDSNKTVIKLLSGIGKISVEDMPVQVFPMPANDQINFVWAKEITTGTLSLTDVSGKLMQQAAIHNTSSVTMSVNTLPAGFYFYTINSSGRTVRTGKIQVVK